MQIPSTFCALFRLLTCARPLVVDSLRLLGAGAVLATAATAATWTVTDNLDNVGAPGAGSLRQALNGAASGDTIVFALPAGSETIAVGAELVVSGKSLTVDGSNAAGSGVPVTIAVPAPGSSPWRVFRLAPGAGNTATLHRLSLLGGSALQGGAVHCESGNSSLAHVTLSKGTATYGGGLFAAPGTSVSLANATITGNSATYGGGLDLGDHVVATVADTTVSGNTATDGGGIVVSANTTATISNTTVGGNTATDGGGLFVLGTVAISNATICDNHASRYGGGLMAENGASATLANVTVCRNSGTTAGGGLYAYNCTASLLNSIVVDNSAGFGTDLCKNMGGTGALAAYACWYVGTFGPISVAPSAPNVATAYTAGNLGALADNGGSTPTAALGASAPAVGRGVFVYRNATDGCYFMGVDGLYHKITDANTAFVPGAADPAADLLATDQRGAIRRSPADIGAFQHSSPAALSVPANGYYKAGSTLGFTLTVTAPVTVDTTGGIPRLVLDVGGQTRYAVYYAAASTATSLVFGSTVASGDNDADGPAVVSLQLNGASLVDGSGMAVDVSFPAVDTSGIIIDTTAPAQPSISSESTSSDGDCTISGTAEAGSTLTHYVDGSQVGTTTVDSSGFWVFGFNRNDFADGSHAVTVTATDAAGNVSPATSATTFTVSHAAVTWIVTTNTDNVAAPTAGMLRHAVNHAASGDSIVFALSAGSETVTIGAALTVSAKSLTIDGCNTASGGSGRPVTIAVPAPSASTWRVFALSPGSGNTVTLGDMTLKGGDVAANSQDGGVVLCSSGTARLTRIALTGGRALAGGAIFVGPNAVLVLTNATVAANSATDFGGGLYVNGHATLANTTVSGNSSGGTGGGLLVEDPGTATLTSCIVAGNTAASSGSDLLNVGTLNLYAGWYPAAGLRDIGTLGTAAATVPNTTTAYTPGDLGSLADNGGETLTMALSPDAPAVGAGVLCYYNATDGYYFQSSAGSYYKVTAPTTPFTPSSADPTADLIATDQRGVTRAAPLSMGAFQLVGVASATAHAAGTYAAGYALSFTVTFSDAVTVDTTSGTPSLVLTIGSTTRYATYASGSGSTALVFNYTVEAGDTDTDGIAVGALSLNSGTIVDRVGYAADLTLPAIDASGILIDTTAPTTALTSTPAALSASATFTFSGADGTGSGVTRIEASLDSGAYATATSPLLLTGLSVGSHTLAVRAVDFAGNVDATPATYTWTIDTAAPTAPTLASTSATAISGTAEAGSTVEVFNGSTSLGTTTADSSGAWTLTVALADGIYSLSATATDAADNTSATSAASSWIVDNTAPTTPTALAATATSTSAISLSWTASSDAVGVAGYRIYRAGMAVGTSVSVGYNDSGLSSGTRYSYTVAAYDAAGHESAASSAAGATTQFGGAQALSVASTGELLAALATVAANPSATYTITLSAGTYSLGSGLTLSGAGLTLQGGGTAILDGAGLPSGALLTVTGDQVVVYNLTFQHAPGDAIAIVPGADRGTVADCTFNGAGITGTGCVGWIVTGNAFANLAGTGATAAAALTFGTGSDALQITDNVIVGCDRGIALANLADPTVRNNFIADSRAGGHPGAGIALGGVTGARVDNNTLYQAGSYANSIEYAGGTATGAIRNNLANKPIAAVDTATATLATNCTSALAGWFGNPAIGDLHLAATRSEVVNVGTTLSDLTVDIDGDPRPTGSASDIGADEFQPDTVAPTAPTGLSATAASSSQISLSWTASTDSAPSGGVATGVSGYRIYRGGTAVGTSTSTSFGDTGLTAGTTYTYTVTSYDGAANESAASNAVSATTGAAGGGKGGGGGACGLLLPAALVLLALRRRCCAAARAER